MKQYIVDAFTDKVFAGNPAAICIMDEWLTDEIMKKIAGENNLSETAFAVKEGKKYHLRWFTPTEEIDLCGHATMACSYVIFNFYEKESNIITFDTLSGDLNVLRHGDLYEMDFPAYDLRPVDVTQQMEDAIGVKPKAAYMGRDLLCIFDDEKVLRGVEPNPDKVMELDGLLLHITARGENADCVSRSFGPKCGIPEDPVCGSGHCHIVPYWADILQKENIVAYQASKRGGTLYCKITGDRIKMSGKAALYSIAEIFVD